MNDAISDTVLDARVCLDRYLSWHPDAVGRLAALALQLEEEPHSITLRSNMRGHLTASALVLSPDLSEVLMIDHLALDARLPAGGHADEGKALRDEALRENVEETGVRDVVPIGPSPLDIDTHPIPTNPRKGEGEHFHHDFMFAFMAKTREIPTPQLAEVAGSLWIPIAEARRSQRIARALSCVV